MNPAATNTDALRRALIKITRVLKWTEEADNIQLLWSAGRYGFGAITPPTTKPFLYPHA